MAEILYITNMISVDSIFIQVSNIVQSIALIDTLLDFYPSLSELPGDSMKINYGMVCTSNKPNWCTPGNSNGYNAVDKTISNWSLNDILIYGQADYRVPETRLIIFTLCKYVVL